MAEIVNLRLARKRRKRADDEAQAAENRAKHGRTKAEKLKEAAEKALAERQIEGHKREE